MPVYSTMFQTALMRLLVALLVTVASAARPTQFDSHSSPTHARLLLQQQTQQNCAPPRPLASAARPFCFQPLTISPEARAFLANTSAAVLPSEDPPAVVQQKAQNFYRELSEPLHAAAVEAYLQTPVNSSIGGVPVVIAAAKGVNASSNADTKVLLYLHGEHQLLLPSCLETHACIQCNATLHPATCSE
jgi:hypothetical protein